jgi:hypothetical protein
MKQTSLQRLAEEPSPQRHPLGRPQGPLLRPVDGAMKRPSPQRTAEAPTSQRRPSDPSAGLSGDRQLTSHPAATRRQTLRTGPNPGSGVRLPEPAAAEPTPHNPRELGQNRDTCARQQTPFQLPRSAKPTTGMGNPTSGKPVPARTMRSRQEEKTGKIATAVPGEGNCFWEVMTRQTGTRHYRANKLQTKKVPGRRICPRVAGARVPHAA